MLLKIRQQEEYLVDALGEGEHSLQVCTPGPPTLVTVQDLGNDDLGDRAFEVEIIDPDSDNNLGLEWVVEHVAWLRRQRLPSPKCNSRYRILPALSPERFQALKGDIAVRSVQVPIIMDQHGNILDGWHRWVACQAIGMYCPTEVRYFSSEAEKFRLVLEVNCYRRQMNRKQKRELVGTYLAADPAISDNWVAETIGGISKNTVADERCHLERAGRIPRLDKLRGKDGKHRRVRSKRIIANSPSELGKALDIIQDVPDKLAGKTLDIITAGRRAKRSNKKRLAETRMGEALPHGSIKLYHCPFQKVENVAGIRPESVEAIITDIPYEKSFLPQVAELAAFAQRVLVDGGVFVTYYGHVYLNKVIGILDKYLTYRWVMASAWDGDANMIHPLQVYCQWKPILVFSKGKWKNRPRYWPDVLHINSKEKQWHDWQEPLEEVKRLVSYFTEPGDQVVDPCGGGFTTALACYHLGRLCDVCELDEAAFKRGMERLNKAMRGEPDRSWEPAQRCYYLVMSYPRPEKTMSLLIALPILT